MADALKLDIILDSTEADGTLARLALAFTKAGDDALTAAEKVEKFEKSYREGQARKAAKAELDALTGSTKKTADATDALTSAAMRYAAPAAIGAAIAKTVEWADRVTDLAATHRMSTDMVQKLTIVAERNGSTFDKYASIMEGAANRIAKGNKKTTEAVDDLGLSVDELRKMRPYEVAQELAEGLARIEDPAHRAKLRMLLFNEAGGDTLQMLGELTDGIDEVSGAVAKDMVAAGDKASGMWGRFKETMVAVTNEAILQSINPFVMLISYVDDLTSSLDTLAQTAASVNALLPASPWLKNGIQSADPFSGAGTGMSWDGLNKSLTPERAGRAARGGSGGQPVIPYTANQWANIQQVLGAVNPLGNGGLGSFPGFAFPTENLTSRGMNFGNMLPPMGASMVSPASMGVGGGGIGSFFSRNGMQLGLIAGGLASQFLPGRAGQVAQGAMGMASQGAGLGAMFGPQGAAIGAGIGALVGGVSSLFGGGKAKKNARNAEISEVFEQFSTKEFIAIQREADKLGVSMEKALSAKTMKDFGAAVDEVTAKLVEMNGIQSEIDMLTEATTPNFEKMSALAKEFGIDINAMGNAFKQQAMDKDAQKIIDAMAYLEKGGADVNGVLDGMQDEISKVVQDSMQFGTTIPENMKPWIQKLAESDRLVDANGTKITDISKLNFGTALESEMDKFVRKLGELIEKLAGVRDGFDKSKEAAKDFNDEAGAANYSGGDYSGGDASSGVPVSRGGVIAGRGKVLYFKQGGFVPRGTDTVPAMLTPGEMVISREMVRGIAKNGGRGVGGVTVNLNIAGYLDSPKVQRELAAVVSEAVMRDSRARRAS